MSKQTPAQRLRKMENGTQSTENEMFEAAVGIQDLYEKQYSQDPNAAFKALSRVTHFLKGILNDQHVEDETKWLYDRGLITKEEYRERIEA